MALFSEGAFQEKLLRTYFVVPGSGPDGFVAKKGNM